MPQTAVSPALLFGLPESEVLAVPIAAAAASTLAPLESRRFESAEFKLRPLVSVRGGGTFVIQTLAATADAPIAERFVRLLFLLATLRDAGAAQRVAVVPYLAYARKDRRTQIRDPVNTRYVAELIEAAGATRLLALDVHNPAALDNAFRIPVDHLSAQSLFAAHFAARCAGQPLTAASPDVGGIKRVQLFRERLERATGQPVELAFVEKRRVGEAVSGQTLAGAVAGRVVVVLDDLCATGGTLLRAAGAFAEAGARAVHVAFTHAPVNEGLQRLLAEPSLASIVTTDSVGAALANAEGSARDGRLQILPIAPLLGSAVRRIATGESLSATHVLS